MDNNKITFTAYLKDEYSKKFAKLADTTDDAVKDMIADLDKLGNKTKNTTRNIEAMEKHIANLTKVKKLSLNTDTIKHAEAEIKQLRSQIDRMNGVTVAGGGVGGAGWMGGLGSGFAVTGGLLAAGAMLKEVGGEAVAATAKYQKFEAVLANTLGSQGAARQKMQELQKFAAETPFEVDELTDSYIRLANMGFKPTLEQMTMLGDLASSRGKGMNQLAEAVIDAQTGEFERLKEFGIKARVTGDKVTFMFNDKKTTVKNTSTAIREYILAMGQANGVTGAMAAISKTTGGMISNLEDEIDLAYKALGDRFKPEIDATISGLSSMVTTIKGWVEIPVSEQLQRETDRLQMLRVELGEANVTEERRKAILEEVKKIQPDIIDGTKKEEEQLAALNGTLDEYLKKRREQISMQLVKEKYAEDLVGMARAKSWKEEIEGKRSAAIAVAAGMGFQTDGLTREQQLSGAKKFLEGRPGANPLQNMLTETREGKVLRELRQAEVDDPMAMNLKKKHLKGSWEAERAQLAIDNALGANSASSANRKSGGSTSTDTSSGSSSTGSSISGGSKVTHLNISIGNLVNGGFTIQTTTMKESPAQIKDLVLNALMTAVNDVNLTATN